MKALNRHVERALGVASCALEAATPQQPKKPAGFSRQASYAVTIAGPWGDPRFACDPTRTKLRNGWTRP
jgi:hypothetical protein